MLLVGLVVTNVTGIGEAHAQVIHCDRKDISKSNLSKESFNNWFPIELNFEATGWRGIENQESLKREEKRRETFYYGNLKYQLLPNGTLLAFLSKKGLTNWRSFTAVRYECDANSIEVASEEFGKAQEKQNASSSTATAFISKLSDASICSTAVGNYTKTWIPYSDYTKEAKRRGLSCDVVESSHTQIAASISDQSDSLASVELKLPKTDEEIRTCVLAPDLIGAEGNRKLSWTSNLAGQSYVNDAKRLGLTCGVSMNLPSTVDDSTSQKKLFSNLQTASSTATQSNTLTDEITGSIWRIYEDDGEITVFHFNQDGTVAYLYLSSPVNQGKTYNHGRSHWSATGDLIEISFSNGYSKMTLKFDNAEDRVIGTLVLNSGEIQRVGGHLENENVRFVGGKFFNIQRPSQKTIDTQIALLKNTPKTQIASSTTIQTKTPSSAELTAAHKEAERLRQELAALKAQQEQQQQSVSNDTKLPTITIASTTTNGAQGIIRGRVNDNTGVAEVRVDAQKIAVDSNGHFSATTYVPEGGTSVNIEAIDLAGLLSTMSVRLNRAARQTASISFDRLNPLKRQVLPNKDAVALIIGIGTYENIIDAAYADKDALVFRDYATEKLGVPDNQIKTLINKEADIGEVLLGIRKWIRRSTKPDKTDVYVFYAGHG